MTGKSIKNKTTFITVEHMVDIALGTPEIGAVNFNVLHALLHVLVQQLNIQKCLVEFKGNDSEKMEGIIMTAKPSPVLKVSECVIDGSDEGLCKTDPSVPTLTDLSQTPGRIKSNLLKQESTVCSSKADAVSQEEKDRKGRCDSSALEKKKDKQLPKEESEMCGDQDKCCRSKDESKLGKASLVGKDLIPEKCSNKEEESEKDPKKLSKEDIYKERKLAKRKNKEEDEPVIMEKSKAEKSESKMEYEEHGKKKRPCSCKEVRESCEFSPETGKTKATSYSYYGSEGEDICTTILKVETIGERCDAWRTKPPLVHESLIRLEEKVTVLQDAIEAVEKMATNEELIKRTSTAGSVSTPIKDMWQLYNLHKRVESCEGAIEKLASMIEDLVKETCNFREALMVIADAVDSMECSEDKCSKNEPSPCYEQQPGEPHGDSTVALTQVVKQEMVAYPLDIKINPCESIESDKTAAETQRNMELQAIEETDSALNDVADQKTTIDIGSDFFKLNTGEKFYALKETINCLMSQLKAFTNIIPLEQFASKMCTVEAMQKYFEDLQREWGEFLLGFSDDRVLGTIKYIKDLRKDIEIINEEIGKILEYRHQLELRIKEVEHEMKILKTIKADKEVMEDLLAEKADAVLVNRKVSHDQFDAACDDLTKGLDEALEKLIAQEALWNEAMDELQKDMDNKLDKVEIMPLKEFINKKLKSLQLKLKQLAQLRKDAEAAGAKSRILRNLNCISCDKDVVMRTDQKGVTTQHPALPPSRTIRPYIAYELDQVRRALKKEQICRGTNHMNKMILEVQKNIGLPLGRDGTDNKISNLEQYCNRYCGGSHTITTPQQRVTRIGHFITEFGSQAMPLYNRDILNLTECKTVEREGTQHQDIITP